MVFAKKVADVRSDGEEEEEGREVREAVERMEGVPVENGAVKGKSDRGKANGKLRAGEEKKDI